LAFATNDHALSTRCYASLDDALEHPAKNLSLAEALIAGTRKHRMIGDSVLDAEPAEPTVGKVHLHFTTEQPFRTDRKTYPTTSIRIINSGSIDGRPIDEY
jgi:hypothetical protein